MAQKEYKKQHSLSASCVCVCVSQRWCVGVFESTGPLGNAQQFLGKGGLGV